MVAASRCDRVSCQCLLRYKPIFLPRSCPARHAPWTLAEVNGDSKLATYLKTAYGEYRRLCTFQHTERSTVEQCVHYINMVDLTFFYML